MTLGRIWKNLLPAKTQSFLFFITIFLIPTQLGKHFWPEFSYIYSLRIDYYSPTLYLWDLILLCLIAVWLYTKPKVNFYALLFLSIFLISQVPSFFTSTSIGPSIVRFWQYFMVCLLGLYISSQKEAYKASIIVPMVWSIMFQTFLGIYQFFSGSSLGLWFFGERMFNLSTPSIATFNWYGQVFLRPYATLPHPNVFGGFLLVSILLYMKLVKKLNIAFFAVTSFSVLAMVLSFSRSVIGVLAVEVLFILRRNVVFLILTFLLLYPFLSVRFQSAFNFDNLSLIRREELAEASYVIIKESPVFGAGLNNFILAVSGSSLISGTSRFFQPVHNIFLLTLAETGVVGLLGFLSLLCGPVILMYLRRDHNWPFYLNILLVLFFLGSLDHYLITVVQGQRLLYLVWGVSMLEYSCEQSEKGNLSNQLAGSSQNI